LIAALEHVWKQVDAKADKYEWKGERRFREKVRVAMECFRGSDKDAFLAKVCKAYMALVGDGRGGVFCANSLQPPGEWSEAMQDKIKLKSFDIVLTNPPFGKNIVVKGAPLLSQFDFGYRWKKDKAAGTWEKQTALFEDQPPQIIFISRCLQLLKLGGRMGIVLPEAVFGMPTYEYVVAYLRERMKIRGIISMPEALFKTSGKGGTHAKVCVLFLENTKPDTNDDWQVFMADVKWCGHDSRGNPTVRTQPDGTEALLDDVPGLSGDFKRIIGSW
jgi:type I restriction enzyme M protein